jgi:hypothetical protein
MSSQRLVRLSALPTQKSANSKTKLYFQYEALPLLTGDRGRVLCDALGTRERVAATAVCRLIYHELVQPHLEVLAQLMDQHSELMQKHRLISLSLSVSSFHI